MITLSTPSISASLTPDHFLARGGHVLAHEVGADRQLAVPAVDDHRELDRARAAEVDECIHRRAHRAAGVEHVVHQHRTLPLMSTGISVEPTTGWCATVGEIVAIEGDVEAALDRRLCPRTPAIFSAMRAAQRHAAAADAHQDQTLDTLVALDDLVGDAGDDAPQPVRVDNLGLSLSAAIGFPMRRTLPGAAHGANWLRSGKAEMAGCGITRVARRRRRRTIVIASAASLKIAGSGRDQTYHLLAMISQIARTSR